MESMNISLPEPLKKFVDHQIAEGRYSSASEYVRELIVMALDIAVGAAPAAARGHARRAIRAGATEAQVLGAVELVALVWAGKAVSALPTIFDDQQP